MSNSGERDMAQPNCNTEHLECPKAREVADEAVRKVFAILGVDIDDPEKVEEFRMDLRFGRSMRRATDKGIIAVVALVAVGVASATWVGITAQLKGH